MTFSGTFCPIRSSLKNPPELRASLVDPVQPNLLLGTGAVRARPQNVPHLLHARKHDLPSYEPPDALVAGGTRQAALVGPELVKVQHALERQPMVQLCRFRNIRLVEADHGRQLG